MAMSPEARKSISDAQKRRHARDRAAAEAATIEDTIEGTIEDTIEDVIGITVLPEDILAEWLKTAEGFACTDTRIPREGVRFRVCLEDAVRKAFLAGLKLGGA